MVRTLLLAQRQVPAPAAVASIFSPGKNLAGTKIIVQLAHTIDTPLRPLLTMMDTGARHVRIWLPSHTHGISASF